MKSNSESDSEGSIHPHIYGDFPDPDGWFPTKVSYNIDVEDLLAQVDFL